MRELPAFGIALCLCLLSTFSSSDSECGNSGRCKRGHVIGGLHTCIEEFPWTSGLGETSKIFIHDEIHFFCGASIISTKFLLSAGHCFKYSKTGLDRKKNTVRVYVGLDNRVVPNPSSTYYFIESVDIHPEWLKDSYSFGAGNDIAIIKVTDAIKFNPTVGPICLPSIEQRDLVQVGRSVKMAGFGTTSPSDISAPQNLLKGDFKILDCDERNNICAAKTEDGRVIQATCGGDSGSGLVGAENGTNFLVGLVSWEWGRCGGNITRYINVFDHLQWIKAKTEDCYTVQGLKCILPFRFERNTYNHCITSLLTLPDKTTAAKCPTSIDPRGEGDDFKECNRKCPGFKTPIHGSWQQWSEWSRCTDGCESGVRTRNRSCSKPQFGGHRCRGNDWEEELCNTRPECQDLGIFVLAARAQQNQCRTEETIKEGRQSNVECVFPFEYQGVVYRGCTNVTDEEGEFWCSTLVNEDGAHVKNEGQWGYCGENCPQQSETGLWEPWSTWSSCTKTCGSGLKHRLRKCQDTQCQGEHRTDSQCNDHSCDLDIRSFDGDSLAQTVKRCRNDEVCTTRENCPDIEIKYNRALLVSKKGSRWKRIIQNIKDAVCNRKEKGFCCKIKQSTRRPPQSTTPASPLQPLSYITGAEDGTYLPRPDNCGVNPIKHKGRKRRAVGGQTTKIGEFPFSALMGYIFIKREYNQLKGKYEQRKTIKYKCGGTLINHWYVLTAAHCQGTKPSSRIAQVVLGEWQVGQDPDCQGGGKCFPKTQTFDIEEGDVIVHENYERQLKNVINNVALVRLSKRAVMNEGVRMACLTFDQEEATRKLGVSDLLPGLFGQNATFIGWGYIGYDPVGGANQGDYVTFGVGSKFQQQLMLPILTPAQCSQKYVGLEVEESQMCAGGELGKDSCKGDSGGGLLLSGGSEDEVSMPWYLIGVQSFGSKTCGNGRPGVYTRVSHYIQWITNNLRP